MTTYFNSLREKGIEVIQEDTLWLDTFCNYVLKTKTLTQPKLEQSLYNTIQIIKEGQTTKDVIALLRKIKNYKINYTEIDKQYEISLTTWRNLLCSLHDNGD